MNAKFFDVNKAKQDAVINAALKTFAQNGYKNASTDIIVKEAGISKGLLFHYFTSKQGLYGFVFDYSVKYMSLELTRAVNKKEKDFFNIQVQIERAKGRVLRLYPYMDQFLYTAQYESNAEALTAISEAQDAMVHTYDSLYEQTDRTKFIEGSCVDRVIQLVLWMSAGLARDKYLAGDFGFDETIAEMEEYLNMLRRHFYKSESDEKLSIAMDEIGSRDDTVMEQFRVDMTFEERLEAGKKPLVEPTEEEKLKEEEEKRLKKEEEERLAREATEADGKNTETERAETESTETENAETEESGAAEGTDETKEATEAATENKAATEAVKAENEPARADESASADGTVSVSTGSVELKVPSFEEAEVTDGTKEPNEDDIKAAEENKAGDKASDEDKNGAEDNKAGMEDNTAAGGTTADGTGTDGTGADKADSEDNGADTITEAVNKESDAGEGAQIPDDLPEIKLPSWWTEGNGEAASTPVSAPVMSIPKEVLHTTLESTKSGDAGEEDEDDEPWTPRPVRQIRL